MPARNRSQLQWERLVVVALIAVVAYLVRDRYRTEERLSSPEYLVELANDLQQESDTGRHAQMILETRALAKQEFLELQSAAKRTETQLAAFKPEADGLDALIEQLRTTSKGKPIAADKDTLEQFHIAIADYSHDAESIDQYQQSLDVLQEPIEAAITAENFEKPPEPEVRIKLDTLLENILRDAKAVKTMQTKVQAILDAAPPDAPEGTATLDEALVQMEQQWAALDAAAASQARQQVRDAYREKFAAQQAQQEREQMEAELAHRKKIHEEQVRADQIKADAEAKRIADAAAAEAKRIKLEGEAEARRIAREAEDAKIAEFLRDRERKAAREAEEKRRAYQAALPEIRKYLVPFITPGNKQLQAGQWKWTEDKRPLSLGQIQARGALRDNDSGCMSFYFIAGHRQNDRPTGVFRGGYIGGGVHPSNQPDVVRAQNLLKQHGDMMVEEGLLLR